MSTSKKIHVDSEQNSAEKVAESVLHWVVQNKQVMIGAVVVVALIVAGVASFQFVQKKRLDEARTEYGRIFIEMQKNGKYSEESLKEVYENSSERTFAGLAAYQLGVLALERADYQASIEWFDNAIAQKIPAEFVLSSAYEGKGVALEYLGSKEEALQAYSKALETKKSGFRRSDVRMKIALLKRNLGDNGAAKRECEAIVSDTLATPEVIQNAKNLLLAL